LAKEMLGKTTSRTGKEAARAWTQTDVSYLSFGFSARVTVKGPQGDIVERSSGPGGPRGLLPWGSHRSVRALSGIRLLTS